uniref:subunit 4 of 26S proteasome n=1 Tax=Haslea karadagensis TaxID=1146996 RepID=UPI002204DC03|nr:subunit 4 of 26S proteasome [Haslea karadagensis]UXN44930.1 subunit 4 of 26S proteasome [Haslea karadagensis]UXN45061.1 subunit 4 of 26S proteasome [Haslea karadagensis]UXN45191.1 subunit 4 of 26S proteasome [Haslea karadagensis]
MKFNDELALFLKARYPIIYINTIEEDRVEYVIRKNVKTNLNRSIYSWDFVDGYTNNPNNEGFARKNPLQALELVERLKAETPALFLLKDFNRFLSDLSVSRKLRNISRVLKLQPKTIIIIGSDLTIPKELQDLITVLQFELPSEQEISEELTRLVNSLNIKIDSQLFENLVRACQGLSLERIRRVLSKIIATYKTINNNSINILLSEKKQIISQTEILEYISVEEKIINLGGLQNLKEWLKKRKTAFTIQASNYGLPTPRGLLLVGIQGTGKSLTAKSIANEWQLPLLKLDVGKLFGGIVGESESRLRQMINVAEAVSPCILWIDEIDKAFNNTENSGDSGTSNRVLGTFVSWLSEKTKPVFVIATANNIELLPLEIIRKGRFDEIFFLDLPQREEREEIFKIHLKEFRSNSWESFDYSKLARLSESFSGAEIRQSIIEGMYQAFYEKREFTTDDICLALDESIPLAHLESEQMTKLKNWATSGRIRLASSKNIYI